jgi:5'-nucleotidase
MMQRKDFIKKSFLLAAGSLISMKGFAQQLSEPAEKVTILYTNDTHARIDPFPEDAVNYAGLGGASRRATLVKRIREYSPHTLLLDAGDVFQGTPWFNLFGGKKDLKLMSMMGYDAMCLGNHEFDNGPDGFAEVATAADFPFLCANYRVVDTPLAPFVRQFIIKEKAGVRFGIFGLGIRLQGLVQPELYGDVRYANPVSWAGRLVEHLKETHRCDYIICLSHLGYHYDDDRIDDRKLAKQVNGIDLIIGGHTHTFLDQPEAIVTPNGNTALVTQAGHSGIRLGRVDLSINGSGDIHSVISHQYTIGNQSPSVKAG